MTTTETQAVRDSFRESSAAHPNNPMIAGHLQALEALTEEDPYSSEDYQKYISECSKNCTCEHDICDSVLAGAPCEDRHDYRDDL